MDFSFNDSLVGRKMFPKGCPNCGGEVVFKSCEEAFGYTRQDGANVYVCSHYPLCDSYVLAHTKTTPESIQNHPRGILANKELRMQHDVLKLDFNRLWQEKLIAQVYHKYVVSFIVDGEKRYGSIEKTNSSDKTYEIKTELGDIHYVPITEADKVNPRSRSHFWLAEKMGLPVQSCKIPYLDFEQTCEAHKIVQEALLSIGQTSEQTVETE